MEGTGGPWSIKGMCGEWEEMRCEDEILANTDISGSAKKDIGVDNFQGGPWHHLFIGRLLCSQPLSHCISSVGLSDKRGGSDGMSLLKLHHKRHCGFHLGLVHAHSCWSLVLGKPSIMSWQATGSSMWGRTETSSQQPCEEAWKTLEEYPFKKSFKLNINKYINSTTAISWDIPSQTTQVSHSTQLNCSRLLTLRNCVRPGMVAHAVNPTL